MRIGLGLGAQGDDVERLHRVLISAGLEVEAGEREGRVFGPSTRSALQAFQARHGLPPSEEIDAVTVEVLLTVEADATVPAGAGEPPRPYLGLVHGRLTDEDGAGVPGVLVALASVQLRREARVGQARTDAAGGYRISYARPGPLNLVLRAYDAVNNVIATSATLFTVPADAEIDITTAPDGIVRTPSQFTALVTAISAALDGLRLVELQQNSDRQDLTFLAGTAGVDLTQLSYLYIAESLAAANGLRPETLFGLFVQGVPPTLKSALGNPPEAGLDATFTAQVFGAVVAQTGATLARALSLAVTADVLPASYAAAQPAELARLGALQVTAVGATPHVRGKTSLTDLLAAGQVSANASAAFVAAYAANSGQLGPIWTVLRANRSLTPASLTALNTVLSAGELLTGNLVLVKDTLARLAAGTLPRLSDLALLDESDWVARITALDPDATSIPQVLPGDTATERIARFAKALAQRFAGRYPTTAFAGGLTKATASSFQAKDELVRFLTGNPSFSLPRTTIDQYVAAGQVTISAAALAELKTAQRLHRVSPHYATVDALHGAGYTSAQSIYFAGRAPFLAQMTTAIGSTPLASMAYARAHMTYATALMTWGRYNIAANGVALAGIGGAAPDPASISGFPDLQALFGSLDHFQCADCQSVYSPAAYLVDLLQYLSGFSATPASGATPPLSAVATARDALLLRRPDIQYVALDCDNTNTTIPYIDLVNEVLEAAIAPAAIARPTVIDTAGTSAERRALPQQIQPDVAAAAYAATAGTTFPLSLPFDVNFAQTTAYIGALGTTRTALLNLFPGASGQAAITGSALGVNGAMQDVVNQPDTASPWTRWGLAEHPDPVIDPKTRQPYSPTPADWVAALNRVPVLLNRTGLSLPQLYQLLEVIWVTQQGVTLQAGTTIVAGLTIISPDTELMTFAGLDGDVLDRANRFLRLWTATGLQMWELDWALEQAVGGALDDGFLAGAMAVQAQLNLPLQDVLTFWAPLETRDVTSHLGSEDQIVPSTYSKVFASPTMLASWAALFGSAAALSGAPIVFPATASPTPADLQPQNGIAAALGLSPADIATILAASGAGNTLTLPTLTALFRYARLASALSLTIPDLTLWITLTGGTPFGQTPADTTEFLRRLAVLQSTGIAVHDLNYLLRGQSAAQSALAVTATQTTAVLQSIRDAVAKAVAASQLTLSSVSDTTPITVATTSAHGLTTGAQVFVTGVLGTTAANGIFTVTVSSPTEFSLDGSAGNGAWSGGGGATPGLEAAIATIVTAALASAVTPDVVTPVLASTGVLPLDAATINALLAQPNVDPAGFPALVAAITQVAIASALFAALAPSPAAFDFIVANAGVFGWLDPSKLPLTPTDTSPYPAFEASLRALRLQQRQAARTPKLFDVLGQWQVAGQLPADVATAIGGPAIEVSGASDTSPIVITTAAPHGLPAGAQVTISLVTGNTAANGTFTVTVTGPDTFSLNGSAGNGVWTGGGDVTWLGAPALAQALNAAVPDVTSIATALGAMAPSLTPGDQAGTLADMATLVAIADALDVLVRYSISGTTLLLLATAAPGPDSATAAMGTLQAQYPENVWLNAVQPVEDRLRQARRDALVAYLLGQAPTTSPGAQFLTEDDIFDYYLIDPEMCPCGTTTRLLQPSLAIQQFVQQCFLGLTFGVTVDTTSTATDQRWAEWSWRQQYRLWQANREVFLYPENYVLPELRTNASPLFTDLENNLRQTNCDADAAEAAYESYLRGLVGASRLVVAAHYNQVNPDGSTVLHVFAHTRGTPAQWFYRTRTTHPPAAGAWSAWSALSLDIASDQLMPVIWDRRLHLVWPVFKQISEKQASQTIPKSGDESQSPPQKFWAVQFAMSELSSGQWQAKHTIDEKMYFDSEDPAQAFMFKAFQDASFNLQLQAYWIPSSTENFALYSARAQLPLPDAPLTVTEASFILPPASTIDLTQEPTYARVTETGLLWVTSSLIVDPTPSAYGFNGQDLVYGNWATGDPGTVPLYVLALAAPNGTPVNLELLGSIASPRIVIPQQELIFDSADPFFVADPERTWLVQPQYWTVSSSPTELDSLAYIGRWNTRYQFQTFYHPYARTFLRELEIGGISQLMARNLQLNPQQVRGWPTTFSFQSLYTPQPPVARPYPGTPGAPDPGETALDFDPACGGAYSLYNWELFYHGPMFVAAQLLQNQQFQDALTWLEYIFNPADNSGGAAPQRFWQMAPFNAMSASAWVAQEIQNLLTTLAADTQQGISDPATQNAIYAWMADPFDPHLVASTRISAYGKATVMRVLDTLIAWGDSLYAQYTAEMVSQAEQLYVLADMILGRQPDELRLPQAQQSAPATYASLKTIDLFTSSLINVENLVVAPEPPTSLVQGTAPSLPQFPGQDGSLLFCIPPNDQLLAYWGTVSQRLYNIRHCLNLQGVAQPLPLYAPPLNPLQLIAEKAGGATPSGAAPAGPVYRFGTYLQRAMELTNDVRAYGAQILAALEKQDGEMLAALRATQELNIQTMILDVKNTAVTEAQDQITALQNQQAVTQIRYDFYSTIAFMNAWETAALALQGGALIANGVAVILDMTAGAAHLAPTATFGGAGFGGSPLVTAAYGGENIGSAASSWAAVARSLGGILSEAGGLAATVGGYQRRQDEWTLQANLAQAELTQIGSQITAATDRLNMTQSEVSIQNTQISNAQAVSDFLTGKYTNAQLYSWMVTQLTTVYAQAYQLAVSLALQAQAAYQYELGRPTAEFIQFAYWDDQYKGLTAGDSLLFDLRRMEAQYLASNVRELELTKHVSLALSQPSSLVQLLQTGSCSIALDETLFDADHPGQYFRRLRSVAVTIPCVSGPYTGVNATLALGASVMRTVPPASGFQPWIWASAGSNTDPAIGAAAAGAATPIMATSSGQNDAGLFEVNLHDERWLPFEGQGAVSTWSLSLDPRDNQFDISSVTDVVLHLRYSARPGGDAEAVRAALKPLSNRTILVSVANTFGDAYYSFFNPADSTATEQRLTLPLTTAQFPFSNIGPPSVTDVTLIVVLAEPLTSALATALGDGLALDGTFGPAGTPQAVTLVAAPGTTASGAPVAGLTSGQVTLTPAAPEPLTLTLPQASLPAVLQTSVNGQARLNGALISDIVLLIDYQIG